MTPLIRANLLVFGLLIVHTLDHAVNQPARDLPVTGSLVAVTGFAIVAAATVLALNRSRLAAPASAVAGLSTAAGIVVIHLAPRWSYVALRESSDSGQSPLGTARGAEHADVSRDQRQRPPQRL